MPCQCRRERGGIAWWCAQCHSRPAIDGNLSLILQYATLKEWVVISIAAGEVAEVLYSHFVETVNLMKNALGERGSESTVVKKTGGKQFWESAVRKSIFCAGLPRLLSSFFLFLSFFLFTTTMPAAIDLQSCGAEELASWLLFNRFEVCRGWWMLCSGVTRGHKRWKPIFFCNCDLFAICMMRWRIMLVSMPRRSCEGKCCSFAIIYLRGILMHCKCFTSAHHTVHLTII